MKKKKIIGVLILFCLTIFFFSCSENCYECRFEYYKNGQFYNLTKQKCGTHRETDKFKTDFCNSLPDHDSSFQNFPCNCEELEH